MRCLVVAALILAGGCSEPPATATGLPPTPRAAAAGFEGAWTVVTINGVTPPPSQSPIRLTVSSATIAARADCAYIGERGYVLSGPATAVLTEAPRGLVTSCARGLSPEETAFLQVFQSGAEGGVREGRMKVEYGARTFEAVRER